jgi:hypothetical protein
LEALFRHQLERQERQSNIVRIGFGMLADNSLNPFRDLRGLTDDGGFGFSNGR